MEVDVIETVLTEVLEELKQLNSKVNSFTAILMEMHEWNNSAMNGVSDKLSQLSTIQMELKALPAQIHFPIEEIRQLKDSLESCQQQLKQPIRQAVTHHVSKIWMVVAGLFVAFVTVLNFLLASNRRLTSYKASDIKYRYLQTNYPGLQGLLFTTDSLYELNPDSFVLAVHRKEEQKKLQMELLQKAIQKENEAVQLRKKASEKNVPN